MSSPAERYAQSRRRAALARSILGRYAAGLDFELDPYQEQACAALEAGGGDDVAHFFGEAMANPAAYGLANATQQAAAGLEPGMWSYDLDQIVENPEEYLFWDHVHPTATGHALLGDLALSLVALPGDFNRDGVVDAADYTLWRNSLGATVTSGTGADANGDAVVDWSDYELWKRHYGQEASFLVLGGRNVPEPMSAILLIGIIAAATLSSYPYFALGRGGGRSQ